VTQSRLRQRGLDPSSSAPGATSRSAGRLTDLGALQKAAGNQAVTALLHGMANDQGLSASHSGLAVQRDVMEYVKDAYEHVKDRVKKKEPGAEDSGEDWEKPSEETALHAREAFDVGAIVLKKVAGAVKAADPEGAAETLEYAEGFEKASELVKTSSEIFDKGVKAVKIAQAAATLYAAIKEVDSHDILSDPEGSARAFDELFSATGEFADRISPKGPWKGYFQLLKHFKDNGGFFVNVGAQMRLEVGPEAEALKRAGIDPKKENRWRTEPAAPPAEKVSLGKLYDNVAAKVDRIKAAGPPPALDLAFDQFQQRYNAFVEAWKFYDKLGIGSRLRQTDAYKQRKAALVSATDDLIASLEGLQRDANYSGTEVVSFQPDIDTLNKVKE
jgi:hypothetical protein